MKLNLKSHLESSVLFVKTKRINLSSEEYENFINLSEFLVDIFEGSDSIRYGRAFTYNARTRQSPLNFALDALFSYFFIEECAKVSLCLFEEFRDSSDYWQFNNFIEFLVLTEQDFVEIFIKPFREKTQKHDFLYTGRTVFDESAIEIDENGCEVEVVDIWQKTIKCPSCGSYTPDTIPFCMPCGTSIGEEETDVQAREKKPSRSIYGRAAKKPWQWSEYIKLRLKNY